MIFPVSFFDFGHAQHIEQQSGIEIMVDQDSTDFIIEKLFGNCINLTSEITMAYDRLYCIFIPIIVHILFYIILVWVKSFETIFRTYLSI
jgi:hypothetical protein